MEGCGYMLYIRKKNGNSFIEGDKNCNKYFISNQIETFGVNYDYVISFEISKEDYNKIKEIEDNRYIEPKNVLNDSIELTNIILNNSEFSIDGTTILSKPDEIFDMESKIIGNDEVLDYLNYSLKKVLTITIDEEKQKNIEQHLFDYYNHLLSSIKETTKINDKNKTAEVLFYDSESSIDLLVNDYYLTNLLLNGLLIKNENKININRDCLMDFLENGEKKYFDFLKSIKK
jgi:hypothetical protein